MFYASISVGVKGWCGEVRTAGEPTQFCKNIPEKSGTENFSEEIWSNPLYIISTPFTSRTCIDNRELTTAMSYRNGPYEVQVNLTQKKKKKLKEWGSFNLISSQLKIARIPTGQFSNRILLLKMWPTAQHQQHQCQLGASQTRKTLQRQPSLSELSLTWRQKPQLGHKHTQGWGAGPHAAAQTHTGQDSHGCHFPGTASKPLWSTNWKDCSIAACWFQRNTTCAVLSRVPLFVTPRTVARLLCPWDFPGKNTGVGCHFLLQGIFLTWHRIFASCISCTGRQILYHCTTWKAPIMPPTATVCENILCARALLASSHCIFMPSL